MTGPRFDADAAERVCARFGEGLRSRLVDPALGFRGETSALAWRSHLRRRLASPSDLSTISVAQARALCTARFSNAGDFVFALTGAIDPARLRPLVERYLASLPGRLERSVVIDRGVEFVDGFSVKTFAIGVEPRAVVQLVFHGGAATTASDRRLRALDIEEHDNRFWAHALAEAYLDGEDPRDLLRARGELDESSAETVGRGAARFLDPTRRALLILLPAKAATHEPREISTSVPPP